MKYSVLGFYQDKAINLGVDIDELLLLRYFSDFVLSGGMVSKVIDGDTVYWFKYDYVIRQLPMVFKSKDTVYRKLKSLVSKGLLIHKTVRCNGTYSYYGFGPKYNELNSDVFFKSDIVAVGKAVDKDNRDKEIKLLDGIQDHYGENTHGGSDKKTYPFGKNARGGSGEMQEQNINLLKDKSIKDYSIKTTITEDIYTYFSEGGFGDLNKGNISILDKLIREYSEDWVNAALREANFRGNRNLVYVFGILKNWRIRGRKENSYGEIRTSNRRGTSTGEKARQVSGGEWGNTIDIEELF